jgi:hypothetical protein
MSGGGVGQFEITFGFAFVVGEGCEFAFLASEGAAEGFGGFLFFAFAGGFAGEDESES